jgi:hypothetical protein
MKTATHEPAADAQTISSVFSPINSTDRTPKYGTAKPKRRRLNPHRIVLSIGFIIIVTLVGTGLVALLGNHGEGSTANQVKSVLSGEELKDYNSPENKFTIKFPGIPKVTKSTEKGSAKEYPITTYERIVDNNSRNYTLRVYDYTGANLDEDKALELALNSALQNTPGATVGTTKKGAYNGLKAIEADYTVPKEDKSGQTNHAHIRYVIKNSRMYSIILINGDQAKFDEYANSLRLG